MIEFSSPFVLFLIPVLIPLVLWSMLRRKGISFTFSSVEYLKDLPRGWKERFRYLPLGLRLVALTLFLVALAGPRQPLEESKVTHEGVNIVLAVDMSTSMATRDFKVAGRPTSRLEVVKKVVADFVSKREHDRIGLVAFAARPYVACPLTTDYGWLKAQVERLDFGLMEDGTAIGSGLAAAIERLRPVEGKDKVIILLTDGINNAGTIQPLEAAQLAKTFHMRVYTIGAGSKEGAALSGFAGFLIPPGALAIDEDSLRKIAEETNGKYFRATDTASLEDIYHQIDALEKVKIEDTAFREYQQLFTPVVLLAFFILFMELILGRTVFLKIP